MSAPRRSALADAGPENVKRNVKTNHRKIERRRMQFGIEVDIPGDNRGQTPASAVSLFAIARKRLWHGCDVKSRRLHREL
jgi:hypothetical protein